MHCKTWTWLYCVCASLQQPCVLEWAASVTPVTSQVSPTFWNTVSNLPKRFKSFFFSLLFVQGLINPWIHLHCFLSPVKSSTFDSCSPKSQIVSEDFIIWSTYDSLHLSSDPWVEQDKNSLKWGEKREKPEDEQTNLHITVVTLLFWLSRVPSFL